MKGPAFVLATITVARVASADPRTEPRSPDLALVLSAGGVVLSSATIAASEVPRGGNGALLVVGVCGLAISPSIGHLYAADYLTWGAGLRLASPLLIYIGSRMSCVNPDGDGCTRPGDGQLVMYGLGVGVFAAGIIYDLVTARSAARRYNREHAVTIAPTPVAGGYGLTVVGQF